MPQPSWDHTLKGMHLGLRTGLTDHERLHVHLPPALWLLSGKGSDAASRLAASSWPGLGRIVKCAVCEYHKHSNDPSGRDEFFGLAVRLTTSLHCAELWAQTRRSRRSVGGAP